MKVVILVISLCTLFLSIDKVQPLNILGIFPYAGKSHFFVFDKYLQELAHRGHNVTVISYFPRKEPLQNYHDISLAGKMNVLESVFSIYRSYWQIFRTSIFLFSSGTENCRVLLQDENVQNLWKTKAKFDLVVLEQFNSDCSLGLAYKLGAPVVALNSHVFLPWQYSRYGITYNPSYMPFHFFEGGSKPTFYQRVERTLFNAYFITAFKLFVQRVDQNTLAEYFDDIPPLEELAKDIKCLLSYTSLMLSGSNQFPTNVIEVGGYHVSQPKPLAESIRKFIEDSEHGVIYISFGSMLKANTTPKDKIEAIVGALSELPQRVLWKWEGKTLPGNPENIFISSWLPQNDVLAHPKVLAFFSHCGMLSTTEAIYHGVPVVGMPIFGDQPANAGFIEESGLGVQIQIGELTKDNLLDKFKTVLEPGFKSRVKLLSKAWHDRPMSPMDSAIYWTEAAARYSNFTFQNPSVKVPLYQYYGLDVLSFLVASSIIYLFIIFKIFSCLCKSKKSTRIKKKKQ
ncbi:UDP-glycosyltransferase UGT5-like [Zerene cesonia]|uniref:UDP-glycosyltransferase UGT5-like n=1 Tax=Zerene cesonia TaxID=33412 RepID=UPI0018E554B9|nr:UDP-glycosyltransferase UGT5-like [Zerene cesonia]